MIRSWSILADHLYGDSAINQSTDQSIDQSVDQSVEQSASLGSTKTYGHDGQPTIRQLPTLLVNQIAAGEVIERPASVLKELVENSIDAGATRITVELEQGGIELIRITDNGCGIQPDQICLALAPHSTSKITESDDLDRISTMGFRGEALASIASVSRVTIQSRPAGFDEGTMIYAEGDIIHDPKPAGCPAGTSIEVRNLFFNTPARRKFLRTATTEQTRCMEWLRDLAMANPLIGVRCLGDGKVKLDLPPDQSPRERALAIVGKELESQLVEVSVDQLDNARGVLMWGLVGLPSVARATSKAQHVFLNGRTIRDRTVQHAIREAYRGLIEPGRHPTAVLMIEMSPGAVDVNVHPAKLEVRFRDQSMVHRVVYHGIRDALMRADVTPTVLSRLPNAGGFNGSTAIMPAQSPDFASANESRVDNQVEQIVEYLNKNPDASKSQVDLRTQLTDVLKTPIEANNYQVLPQTGSAVPMGSQVSQTQATPQESLLPPIVSTTQVLQVHSSYLICQDEHGVLIIDQHALHERMMFNTLLARVTGSGSLEEQGLLTPIVVEVAPVIVDQFDELGELFERIGINAAPMGPRSVGVSSVPSFLLSRNVDPGTFLDELFERIEREGFVPSKEEALHEVLDMMSCKAAIKAGDRLSETELSEIIALRETTERAASCPHGRPTTVRLTIEELEKLFDRR
ncbi:MAG: DNA mismatch repair endonuclease MutL [Phycisphaerales bacterium]